MLRELPPVDIVITMGYNVSCPSLPCRYREDWELDDPTGKEDRRTAWLMCIFVFFSRSAKMVEKFGICPISLTPF